MKNPKDIGECQRRSAAIDVLSEGDCALILLAVVGEVGSLSAENERNGMTPSANEPSAIESAKGPAI
jgi:hypothetical protein